MKNGCSTYAESFDKVRENLHEMMKYHEKFIELEEAIENVKELVNDKLNDEEEQNAEDDVLECDPLEVGNAIKDFYDIGNNMPEQKLNRMIAELNADQWRVFDKVCSAIESNSENDIMRLFGSGEVGTGKSRLIETVRTYIKQSLPKDTVVTAPTGIAAFYINGLTVHRLFQLPVEQGGTAKYKPLSDTVLEILHEELKNVILIIIDEVSMISNVIIMYINLRLIEIFDTSECENGWFVKKHVLLFGDLLHLPPVQDDPSFVKMSKVQVNKLLGALSSFDLWSLFHYDKLTINMRQRGDETYRQMLSKIRFGILTRSDIDLLKCRKLQFKTDIYDQRLDELCNYIHQLPEDAVCLLPTCHLCDFLNSTMLDKINTEEIDLVADDEVNCSNYLKKQVAKKLKKFEDDHSLTAGLAKSITIKIGAKIMIRRNIDVTLGLVNETIATVKSVTKSIDRSNIIRFFVKDYKYPIKKVSITGLKNMMKNNLTHVSPFNASKFLLAFINTHLELRDIVQIE